MPPTTFEQALSVELLLILFSYLTSADIYYTFFDLNLHLNTIISNIYSSMALFIAWKSDEDDGGHVLGIYKNKDLAIQKRDEHNERNTSHIKKKMRKEDSQIENVLICEDGTLADGCSTIGRAHKTYCSRILVKPRTTTLFFSKIEESGGAGKYHEVFWIIVSESLDSAIDKAVDYFELEHNRDDECEECKEDGDRCKNELVESLKNGESGSILCTDYEGAIATVWDEDVNSNKITN